MGPGLSNLLACLPCLILTPVRCWPVGRSVTRLATMGLLDTLFPIMFRQHVITLRYKDGDERTPPGDPAHYFMNRRDRNRAPSPTCWILDPQLSNPCTEAGQAQGCGWASRDKLFIYWRQHIPSTAIKGVVFLAHGAGEHSGRYVKLPAPLSTRSG